MEGDDHRCEISPSQIQHTHAHMRTPEALPVETGGQKGRIRRPGAVHRSPGAWPRSPAQSRHPGRCASSHCPFSMKSGGIFASTGSWHCPAHLKGLFLSGCPCWPLLAPAAPLLPLTTPKTKTPRHLGSRVHCAEVGVERARGR